MLSFFRKIRWRLASDNQFFKYSRYAIGEIVLVVIGILIALQINNWNEGRKERKKEKQLLISLSEDFNSNQQSLERSIRYIPLLMERYSLVLEYAALEEGELTAAMKDTVVQTAFVITSLVDGALTAAISSNQLEIIQNDSLKRWLTKYPAYAKDFLRMEQDLIDYVKDVQRPIVRSYVNLNQLIHDPRFDNLKQVMPEADYQGLLRDRTYLNAVIGIRFTNGNLLTRCNDLLWVTKEINRLIDGELNRFDQRIANSD